MEFEFSFKWLPNSKHTRAPPGWWLCDADDMYPPPPIQLPPHLQFFSPPSPFAFAFSFSDSLLMPVSFNSALRLLLRIADGSTARHSIYIPYIAECSFTCSIVELKVLYTLHESTRVLYTIQTKNKKKNGKNEFLLHFSNAFFPLPFTAALLILSFEKFCSTFTIACVIAHRLGCKRNDGNTHTHTHEEHRISKWMIFGVYCALLISKLKRKCLIFCRKMVQWCGFGFPSRNFHHFWIMWPIQLNENSQRLLWAHDMCQRWRLHRWAESVWALQARGVQNMPTMWAQRLNFVRGLSSPLSPLPYSDCIGVIRLFEKRLIIGIIERRHKINWKYKFSAEFRSLRRRSVRPIPNKRSFEKMTREKRRVALQAARISRRNLMKTDVMFFVNIFNKERTAKIFRALCAMNFVSFSCCSTRRSSCSIFISFFLLLLLALVRPLWRSELLFTFYGRRRYCRRRRKNNNIKLRMDDDGTCMYCASMRRVPTYSVVQFLYSAYYIYIYVLHQNTMHAMWCFSLLFGRVFCGTARERGHTAPTVPYKWPEWSCRTKMNGYKKKTEMGRDKIFDSEECVFFRPMFWIAPNTFCVFFCNYCFQLDGLLKMVVRTFSLRYRFEWLNNMLLATLNLSIYYILIEWERRRLWTYSYAISVCLHLIQPFRWKTKELPILPHLAARYTLSSGDTCREDAHIPYHFVRNIVAHNRTWFGGGRLDDSTSHSQAHALGRWYGGIVRTFY